MPAKSKQQQKFMGMVHALNKGDIKPSNVSKSVRDVAKNIKKSDAEDFASTKHSGLPKKVKEQILKALKEYANKMAGNKLGGSGSYGYAPQKGLRDDDGYDDEGPKDEGFASDAQRRAAFASGYKAKGKKGKKESVNEGMFSTLDQIRKDSKDVRDFVKNVFKDRDFMKMKNDKEFIKYLKSIYEGVAESKGVPQNYMQGRTSDYHTALRGKKRDYSGGTNFKKTNHGQPDIENAEEDEEVGLTNKQTPVNENEQYVAYAYKGNKVVKTVRDSKYNDKLFSKFKKDMERKGFKVNIDLLKNRKVVRQVYRTNESVNEAKYYNKADALTAYFKGKINAKELDSIARKQFKTGIATKKELSNFLSNGFTQDVMSDTYGIPKGTLVKRVRGLMKFTESIDEYGQRLDLSFIDDKEARLKGTPEPKDAIDRDIEEYSGGSYEYTKGDQYGQNSVNEIGVFPVQNYVKGIIPSNFIDTTTRDKKERLKSTLRDLKNTLNHFWKQHKIPYRIR